MTAIKRSFFRAIVSAFPDFTRQKKKTPDRSLPTGELPQEPIAALHQVTGLPTAGHRVTISWILFFFGHFSLIRNNMQTAVVNIRKKRNSGKLKL